IASAVLVRCEKCVEIHSQRALDNGATKDEIAEAISVAMFIAGGSQLHWTDVYDSILKDAE
ncbi:MAG: alkylhydroperoxidase like protein, AhpD family, partial [Methanolobus sp. T82-4]